MIHPRIKDRVKWLKELWEIIKADVKDEEIARVIYKKVVFEE
jgi:uncharacterized tellurite resistance protein B-like protein